jgi:hypothetical protein
MSDYGTGMTPKVTSHGEVNFFEKSFEKALDVAMSTGNPIQAHQGPSISANLKPTSIQLISPPSDGAYVLNKEDYLNSHARVLPSFSGEMNNHDQPNSMKYPPPISTTSLSYGYVNQNRPIPIRVERPMVYVPSGFPPQAIQNQQAMHNQRIMYTQPPPPQQQHMPMMGPFEIMKDTAEGQSWLSNVQKVKANSLEKQLKSQEKNRLAAMKSRQRKKLEWERLVDAEKELLNENQKLRQRIVSLETELETLKEIMLKSK